MRIFAATLALAGAIGLSSAAGVLAKDATPAAGALDPSHCVTPSSPLRNGQGAAAAASPVAEEVSVLTKIEDETVVAEATAAIENLYACYNAGDGVSYVLLYTDGGIEANYGDVARDVLAAGTSTVSAHAPAHDIDVFGVFDYQGQPAVEYQVTLGHQVWRVMDVLVEHEGVWVVEDTFYANPLTDEDVTTAGVKVSTGDAGLVIEVTPNPIMNQPAVRFQLDSQTGETAYFALLQGEEASGIENLDLANLPEGVAFIGEEVVTPEQRVEALFEGLPEGEYVIFMDTAGETGTVDLTIDPAFDPTV